VPLASESLVSFSRLYEEVTLKADSNLNTGAVDSAYLAFKRAVEGKASNAYRLRQWSAFIRIRDGFKCVVCNSEYALSAHHICRKCFLPGAQFLTGNGITLCIVCHRHVHAKFNGKPDLNRPMDEQGGEKIDVMCDLYGDLHRDASRRGLLCEAYYFLHDGLLSTFKRLQGFQRDTQFPGCSLEQAILIWSQPPLPMRNAILLANSLAPSFEPLSAGVTIRKL
jgi:hypothetical protein